MRISTYNTAQVTCAPKNAWREHARLYEAIAAATAAASKAVRNNLKNSGKRLSIDCACRHGAIAPLME